MILQTGGFALGAISIKSNPSYFANDIALFVFKIHKFSPLLEITCTSGEFILLLVLGPLYFVLL